MHVHYTSRAGASPLSFPGPFSPASSVPDGLFIDTRGSEYDELGMAVYPPTTILGSPAR